MFKKMFLFIILVCTLTMSAQTQLVLDADYSREVIFKWESGSYVGANTLDSKPTTTKGTYLRFGVNRWFVFLQWTLLDNLIPDGSTIDYVELSYSYSSDNTSYEQGIYYDDKDISDASFSYSDYNSIYSNFVASKNISGTVTINSNTYTDLITAVDDGLANDRVTFIVCRNSSIDVQGRVSSPELTIHFTPPQQLVYVKQKYSNGSEFGSVDLWETNAWEDEASGYQYSFGIGETEYLQAKTSIDNSEKFNNWNTNLAYKNFSSFEITTTMSELTANFNGTNNGTVKNSLESTSNYGGSVQFKDPWYRDDNSDSKATRNRGTSAIWHSSSIFNLTTASAYQGVFLGQNPTFDIQLPIYTVKTTSPQTIYVQGKNRSFYFQNWESSGASFQNSGSLETPVVFNSSGAEVKAIMKGTGLSNNSSAYTHNNQRKVVKTSNGNLHMVYESMGHIWHEMSTDDGDNWTIMNSGAPIDDSGDLAKSPSVTLDYNNTDYFFLVYQEVYLATDDNQIVVKRISETGLEDWTNNVDLVMSSNSIDLEPVVACNYSNLLVVYRVEDNDIPGSSLGLNYTFYSRAGNPVVYTKQVIGGLVTGTYSTSINPALASRQYPSSASMYYLAWKQGSNIQFTKIDVVNNSSLTFNTIETPTSGSGNSYNYSPSITANGSYVYLAWRGKRKEYVAGGTNKVSAIGSYVYIDRVNYRMRDYSGNWGTLSRYGSDVSDPSINSAGSAYMYCWSENSGSTNKFVRSDETTVKYFSTNGEDLQSGNGLVNLGQMQAVSFNKTTLPYDFNPTSLLSDIGLNKTESIVMNYGREGIVNVDGAELTFTIGDVLLDGEPIDFVSVTDSTVAGNLTELNSYLKTNPFNITSGSELMMSLMFGVVNDSLAKTKLTEEDYVNFKMELFDSKTKDVIGSFDDVTFTEGNVEQYANISYLLETDGIGNREVELRLVVDDNVGASYSIARIYSDKEVLTKSTSKSISYQGSLEVKDYSLSQNYPNPFNPSTTIKYQIPEDGFVSVKIYDITGSEVTTLVNRAQTKGRYQVTFDASNLSSGVYFYRIQSVPSSSSGEGFVKTMKMILLK